MCTCQPLHAYQLNLRNVSYVSIQTKARNVRTYLSTFALFSKENSLTLLAIWSALALILTIANTPHIPSPTPVLYAETKDMQLSAAWPSPIYVVVTSVHWEV